MRRLMTVLFGIGLGAGLVLFACHYHLIRTKQEHLVVRKQQISLTNSYVDVRLWGLSEWQEHPKLARAVVDAGHSDIIVTPTTSDVLRDLFNSLGGGVISGAGRQE
jgi:hypothetical protein